MPPVSKTRNSNPPDGVGFETFLADLAARFIYLEPDEVDAAIEDVERQVCEFLDLDIAVLWQWCESNPNVLALTHLYRRYEGPPVPPDLDARESFPWTLGEILAGRTVRLRRPEDAPPEARIDLESWRHFELASVLVIPLVGIMSFHTSRESCEWTDEITQRLQLVAQIFTNALVRKQAETALRDSEARLQLAAESAEIGMWELDVESGNFWANDRARRLFRFGSGTEVSMERVLDAIHPDDRERVDAAVGRAVADGRPIDVEYRVVLPDGDERWVRSQGRIQKTTSDDRPRLLGASMDVTARKHSEEQLRSSLEEVERLRRRLELENAYLKREVHLRHGRGRIVGESPAMLDVLSLVEQVAATESSVLIQGETGTGKELVARRLHELSSRSHRPLVTVNCAALPSTLVESELFGREKGAYTGALTREAGRFEIADGATLLLDEIAELPVELQPKLLRVLEEGEFERLGSPKTLKTDVRVIAATNRNLEAEVEAGRFRRDLYFRLAVFPIEVPPLRDRRDDIPLLVWSMVEEFARGMNKVVESIRQSDMDRLKRYDWPGNVRELRNVVERALILCDGPTLRIEPPVGSAVSGAKDGDRELSLEWVQRRHIVRVLESVGGRVGGPGGAAELLEMKPTTLRSRMQRLGLDPKRLRDE